MKPEGGKRAGNSVMELLSQGAEAVRSPPNFCVLHSLDLVWPATTAEVLL